MRPSGLHQSSPDPFQPRNRRQEVEHACRPAGTGEERTARVISPWFAPPGYNLTSLRDYSFSFSAIALRSLPRRNSWRLACLIPHFPSISSTRSSGGLAAPEGVVKLISSAILICISLRTARFHSPYT